MELSMMRWFLLILFLVVASQAQRLSPEQDVDLMEDQTAQDPISSAQYNNNAFLYGSLELAYVSPRKDFMLDSLMDYAADRLGTRYRYGSNGPSAFDCSGFVNYVFNRFGIDLPRHSGNIAQKGVEIDPSEARKGDIIYFASSSRSRRVDHVGIVTGIRDGIVHFIHAATSRGVRYDNTAMPYFRARMLGIRRIVAEN
jgi:cell wall-associated NlpC family hydrolase